MIPALVLIIAYLLGSIPSGLIAGKAFFGIDIREHGSGNLGATNSFRVLGKKAGAFVTAADILKGTAAASIPIMFDDTGVHALLAGLAAVIGHIFPVFAGFRGGKAVATSAGVLLAYEPLFFLLLIAIFLVVLLTTKYVSVASVIAALAAFIYAVVHTFYTQDIPFLAVVTALAFFVVYRHRANMTRLRNGTEPKIPLGGRK